MDYALAFKAFFGMSPDNIKENVIITNISPIYTAIIGESHSAEKFPKGFYEVTEICLSNGQNYDIVKIVPGSGVIDVVKLLTPYVKKLHFVGIAGCLDPSRSMGEVCEPSEFVSPNSLCVGQGTAICQTSGLIQTHGFYEELQRRGIALVDMECYDVYSICKNSRVPLKYIVQISDFPLETPFYNVCPQPINIERIINLL